MYLVFLSLSQCIAYFVISFLFNQIFEKRNDSSASKIFRSLILLTIVGFALYSFSLSFDNYETSNRLLHVLGGGFLTFFTCFLAVKDGGFNLNKFQFFIFASLLVIALGVVNETLEFFGQYYFDFVFATNINDTWLDLVSNTVGIFLGAICFVPFIKKHGI